MRLNEIYREFRDRVGFYCIYIREAHPTDGWQVQSNIDEAIIYHEPQTLDERAAIANVCMLKLELQMPMLLDDMSNTVDELYNALPERLYLIDAEGNVAWKTVAGSGGFDPEAWRDAIDRRYG